LSQTPCDPGDLIILVNRQGALQDRVGVLKTPLP
jgi:hypothetical protein